MVGVHAQGQSTLRIDAYPLLAGGCLRGERRSHLRVELELECVETRDEWVTRLRAVLVPPGEFPRRQMAAKCHSGEA